MITVYQVINQADNCPCGPGRCGYHYERQDEAESFRAKLASLTGEPTERYAVAAVALDTLPARRVVVRGSEIGYQFNRESGGERTLIRTVTGVRQEGGRYVGETEVLGRRISVASDHIWFTWRYVEDV